MYDEYKIVVIGTGGVGKSCLTIQFMKRVFVEKYDPTIEDSYEKLIEVDSIPCRVEVLDTAGTEQFVSLSGVYMKGGDAFMMVYSIIAHSTIDALSDIRTQIKRVKDEEETPMILVGNKSDLETQRVIPKEEGQRVADSWGIPFFETSAKKLENVDEAFIELIRYIRRVKPKVVDKDHEEKKRRCIIL